MSGTLSKCLPFNSSFPYLAVFRRQNEPASSRVRPSRCETVKALSVTCTIARWSSPRAVHTFPPSSVLPPHSKTQNLTSSIGFPPLLDVAIPSDPLPISVFVDAASSFGIGFLADSRWLAWRLLDGWNSDGRDIGWAEMVAVDLGLRTLIHSGFKNCHLLFHSDNKGVVDALLAGKSRVSAQHEVLGHIVSNFRDYNIWPRIKWVRSADNKSDSISRGVFPSSLSRHPRPPPLPKYLKRLVSLV